LYRIGERWAAGELTVANEHTFTAVAVSAVELLFTKDTALQARRQSHNPDVLLVMAENNYHTLGLRMAELGLCLQGLTTFTVMPGLPAREILALSESLRPKVLGMSVALATQMQSVREVHGLLSGLPSERRPRLAIGGSALRMGLEVPKEWGIEVITDLELTVSS
jgi:methanogenic corrinoid protein MtbC1